MAPSATANSFPSRASRVQFFSPKRAPGGLVRILKSETEKLAMQSIMFCLFFLGTIVTQQNTVYIPSSAECTVELHFCTFGLMVICATVI